MKNSAFPGAIAAICTPPFQSGIGVLRLCGSRALEIAALLFRGAEDPLKMKGNTCCFGHLFDTEGTQIDNCVLTVFRAPKSFTGEDTAELSLHGSPFLLAKALGAFVAAGARPAQAGEFTKLAVLNGKLSLTQAEAVIDLIEAESDFQAGFARRNLSGALHREISQTTGKLIALISQMSAVIDFPDEDLAELSSSEAAEELSMILEDMKQLLSTFGSGKALKDGISVTITGAPNTGKSSLLNLLSGEEKSIVTNIAGTTRDVVEEKVFIGGVPFMFADTAGIRSSDDIIEQEGVRRALDRAKSADLALCVFDGSRTLQKEDLDVMDKTEGVCRIAVVNKHDLPQKIDRLEIERRLGNGVLISAKTGEGKETLQKEMLKRSQTGGLPSGGAIIASQRQFASLQAAEKTAAEAFNLLLSGGSEDVFVMLLEQALEHLLELTGERVSEKILDDVFSRFCVGK